MLECPGLSLAEARREVFQLKISASSFLGWSPRIRKHFGYFTPDEWYEAVVYCLVSADTAWLDVGCGRDLFPSNTQLAHILSARCRSLVGVDPSDNIQQNLMLHERHQCTIEAFADTMRQFDLVTFRMVAEHIADPELTLSALDRLTRSGGRVIIYTVGKYTPAALIARLTPISMHQAVREMLWGSCEEDTFPTVYRMNTRKRLRKLFAKFNFREEKFYYLSDCRSFERWKWVLILELSVERALRILNLHYPEMCLLGIYKKK